MSEILTKNMTTLVKKEKQIQSESIHFIFYKT